MEPDEMLRKLREEAKAHTPDVRESVLAAARAPAAGEVLVKGRRRGVLFGTVLAVCLLLFALAVALFFLPGGGNGDFRLVISINPSVEFTLRDGKVASTRSLNRDCAVLLKDENFTGKTAEEACLRFAALAEGKHLIGADGIRLYVDGADGTVFSGLKDAVSRQYGQYAVDQIDEVSLSGLFASYDETEMGDFEDWLSREYEDRNRAFEAEISGLLASYESDLGALDPADKAAVSAFGQKYLKLGEDLIFEDGDETKETLLRNFRALAAKLENDPGRALDELFREFLDEIEDLYEDSRSLPDTDDEEDDDDEDEEDDDDD